MIDTYDVFHSPHKVTQYKKGKDSLAAQGKRRYDRKQSGYGGQTKPVFHKKVRPSCSLHSALSYLPGWLVHRPRRPRRLFCAWSALCANTRCSFRSSVANSACPALNFSRMATYILCDAASSLVVRRRRRVLHLPSCVVSHKSSIFR